jgi:hypothetical protein
MEGPLFLIGYKRLTDFILCTVISNEGIIGFDDVSMGSDIVNEMEI